MHASFLHQSPDPIPTKLARLGTCVHHKLFLHTVPVTRGLKRGGGVQTGYPSPFPLPLPNLRNDIACEASSALPILCFSRASARDSLRITIRFGKSKNRIIGFMSQRFCNSQNRFCPPLCALERVSLVWCSFFFIFFLLATDIVISIFRCFFLGCLAWYNVGYRHTYIFHLR